VKGGRSNHAEEGSRSSPFKEGGKGVNKRIPWNARKKLRRRPLAEAKEFLGRERGQGGGTENGLTRLTTGERPFVKGKRLWRVSPDDRKKDHVEKKNLGIHRYAFAKQERGMEKKTQNGEK